MAPVDNDNVTRSNSNVVGVVSTSATTKTLPASITGVPVMPSGMMSPHGKLSVRGVPTCVLHTTCPVVALSEYTVSFSVATTSWLPMTTGCP